MSATAAAMNSGFTSRLSAGDMNVTPKASEQLAALMSQVDDADIEAVRVFVSGGGCGGMTYGMTFTDRRHDHDCVLEGAGYKLYVDAVALNYLRGVEIDYVERPMGASFVFNNVFSSTGGKGTCGTCGASGGGCG